MYSTEQVFASSFCTFILGSAIMAERLAETIPKAVTEIMAAERKSAAIYKMQQYTNVQEE